MKILKHIVKFLIGAILAGAIALLYLVLRCIPEGLLMGIILAALTYLVGTFVYMIAEDMGVGYYIKEIRAKHKDKNKKE